MPGDAARRPARGSQCTTHPSSSPEHANPYAARNGMTTILKKRRNVKRAILGYSMAILGCAGCCLLAAGSVLQALRSPGGVIVYLAGVLFMFLGIAIICDDFFVASLEAISTALNLSEDVAGATFMAAGSSAPELFASIVSIANPNAAEELGVGTIVGSAVFNILMIIGATGVFAGQVLHLDWRPLVRDAVFYLLAVLSVILAFLDGVVHWYEGLGFVIAYAGYIGTMAVNEQLMQALTMLAAHLRPRVASLTADAEAAKAQQGTDEAVPIGAAGDADAAGAENEDEDDKGSPFALPESRRDIPLWLLSLPWYVAFTFTVPPCGREGWEKYYMLSFAMTIGWIAFISWYMVEWTARIGCILSIPNVVMGVTVLAAGTSIPDCLASIVVAKQGQGDMAIANAVGSNVFDIWLGLGAPWAVILAAQRRVLIPNTSDLVPSMLILLGILVIYFGSIAAAGWRMTPRIGTYFMLAYGVYAIYNIVAVWILGIYE